MPGGYFQLIARSGDLYLTGNPSIYFLNLFIGGTHNFQWN